GTKGAGKTGGSFPDQNPQIPIQRDIRQPIIGWTGLLEGKLINQVSLVTGNAADELGAYLLRPIARVRRQCPSRQLLLTEGLPKPEEDHSRFLFGLQAHQQYRTGVLKISEA